MASDDAAVLLKWMTDMRVLEFYEGRDKRYTPELIQEDFFEDDEEDGGNMIKAILEYDGKSIGYGQIYGITGEAYEEYGYENRNETVYGIDQFIGEPDYWNRGIGTEYLRIVLKYLREEKGADAVILDPHQDNARAIKCYQKTGFRIIKSLPEHELHEGKMRDCYLMEYRYRDNGKNIQAVRFLIESSFKDIKVDSVQLIGSGNDCDAYEINDNIIFKFPKHERADFNIKKEIEILLFLENKLSCSIPKVLYVGVPNIAFRYHFGGFGKIDGIPLSKELYSGLSAEEKDNLAWQLAEFLQELHSLEYGKHEQDMLLKYREDYGRLEKLTENELDDKTKAKLNGLYSRIFSNKDLLDVRKTLVHNDFSCGNILFDVEEKRVSGIIDFGDSCVSDADNDFYYLLEESEEEMGRDFGLKVLSRYGHPDIDKVLRKADFHESYWCIEQILYGYEYGYADWIHEGLEKLKELDSCLMTS